MLSNRTSTYTAQHVLKKNKAAPPYNPDQMLTDRAAYITYLESQLDNVSSACLTASTFNERIEQNATSSALMEEKLLNVARLVKCTQTFSEEQEGAFKRAFQTVSARVKKVEDVLCDTLYGDDKSGSGVVSNLDLSVLDAKFRAWSAEQEDKLAARVDKLSERFDSRVASIAQGAVEEMVEARFKETDGQIGALEGALEQRVAMAEQKVMSESARLASAVEEVAEQAASKEELHRSVECIQMLETMNHSFRDTLERMGGGSEGAAGNGPAERRVGFVEQRMGALATDLQDIKHFLGLKKEGGGKGGGSEGGGAATEGAATATPEARLSGGLSTEIEGVVRQTVAAALKESLGEELLEAARSEGGRSEGGGSTKHEEEVRDLKGHFLHLQAEVRENRDKTSQIHDAVAELKRYLKPLAKASKDSHSEASALRALAAGGVETEKKKKKVVPKRSASASMSASASPSLSGGLSARSGTTSGSVGSLRSAASKLMAAGSAKKVVKKKAAPPAPAEAPAPAKKLKKAVKKATKASSLAPSTPSGGGAPPRRSRTATTTPSSAKTSKSTGSSSLAASTQARRAKLHDLYAQLHTLERQL